MSMKNFQKLIKETAEYVLENLDNYILIGENISGKSELLYTIMNKCKQNPFYFIDSVNRSFHLNEISNYAKEKKEYDYREIIVMRMQDQTFNKNDSFGSAKIESIYWMYEDRLKILVSEFLGLQVNIVINDNKNSPVIIPARLEIEKGRNFEEQDNEKLNMSNGMQAVFRLFLELLFWEDNVKKNIAVDDKCIVFIEELDLYLSENYAAKIFNYIRKKFPQFDFIISTHSRVLTVTAEETNVIAIKEMEKWIINGGESYELDVEELFANIFFTEEALMHTNDNKIDRMLRILLNNRINGAWSQLDKQMLDKINQKDLKPHQHFVISEIEDWSYD